MPSDTPKVDDAGVTPTLESSSSDGKDVTMDEAETPSVTASKSSAGIPGYFGRKPFNHRLGLSTSTSERDKDRDETASTTTNVSNRAVAGSVAPSPPYSPMEESPSTSAQTADAHRTPKPNVPDMFHDTSHADAEIAAPPQIHLEPRTHPLGRDGAQVEVGGVSTLTAARETVPLSEAALRELDREVEEEGSEDGEDERLREYLEGEAAGNRDGGEPGNRVTRKIKGGVKVLAGKMKNDEDVEKQGKTLLS
ncbi:hypothetical protein MIND_01284700 [Mycena indigotica]|uniref:Uncharacterized protein n=1 Tax=Mycena indigotica TaxID=2126181 RepID=A0A8H6S3K2_9AGAR|nr:uncharacterized protein MIND_01284700 [Mycena indigotica]KAF7291401.1 hypothetical protein MIND_01284700 [Mycena indigotica]